MVLEPQSLRVRFHVLVMVSQNVTHKEIQYKLIKWYRDLCKSTRDVLVQRTGGCEDQDWQKLVMEG